MKASEARRLNLAGTRETDPLPTWRGSNWGNDISWQSANEYEHPHPRKAGTFGRLTLFARGEFGLAVGGAFMDCPQDWAAGIKDFEDNDNRRTMILRNVPDSLRRAFKARCAREGVSLQDQLVRLMTEYVMDHEHDEQYKD